MKTWWDSRPPWFRWPMIAGVLTGIVLTGNVLVVLAGASSWYPVLWWQLEAYAAPLIAERNTLITTIDTKISAQLDVIRADALVSQIAILDNRAETLTSRIIMLTLRLRDEPNDVLLGGLRAEAEQALKRLEEERRSLVCRLAVLRNQIVSNC